jgi:uncharacterized protein
MIAVDANVLLHAHRADSPLHALAAAVMRQLAETMSGWGLPWPCVHEFYAKVTQHKSLVPPSGPQQAMAQIETWLSSPSVSMLGEALDHWPRLQELLTSARIQRPMVHDARIARACLSHGVVKLLTANRDFGRVPGLKTRNPLIRHGMEI